MVVYVPFGHNPEYKPGISSGSSMVIYVDLSWFPPLMEYENIDLDSARFDGHRRVCTVGFPSVAAKTDQSEWESRPSFGGRKDLDSGLERQHRVGHFGHRGAGGLRALAGRHVDGTAPTILRGCAVSRPRSRSGRPHPPPQPAHGSSGPCESPPASRLSLGPDRGAQNRRHPVTSRAYEHICV